jgi:hypothetical protein
MSERQLDFFSDVDLHAAQGRAGFAWRAPVASEIDDAA